MSDDDVVTDDETSESEEPVEVLDGTDPETGPKALRARLKSLEDEKQALEEQNQALQAGAMADAYAGLGLDPTHGIGKAAAVTYEGEPSGLAAYVAEEFDYLGPENPIAAEVLREQARLDSASIGAGSVAIPTSGDKLAEAEAQGDWETALNMESQEIAGWFQR